MTGRIFQHGHRELPIGRRMAQLRARRGLSQQALADRIGMSKSWVDKVERGVRVLDRLPMIEKVATVLGVAPDVLVGRAVQQQTPVTGLTAGVERVREALASYDLPNPTGHKSTCALVALEHQVGYAWTAYWHAHHPQVLQVLPDLLFAARCAIVAEPAAAGPGPAAVLLVRVYQLAAQLLVKLGEANLAWLAADRAMATAASDPRCTALAAIPLAQALRALNRGRLAMAAATTAARPLPPIAGGPSVDLLDLAGTLLTEAALAAASCGDSPAVENLTDRAAHLAATITELPHHDHDGGYGPIMVDLTRTLTAAQLGEHDRAVALHQHATSTNAWQRLPAEHRAAHLIDIAAVHLNMGDHRAAGQALVTADRIGPAEVRLRPAAHTLLTALLHTSPNTADVTRLAATIGLARPCTR